jgi:hypothetical protein
MVISPISTSCGCSMAKATALATASGESEIVHRAANLRTQRGIVDGAVELGAHESR